MRSITALLAGATMFAGSAAADFAAQFDSYTNGTVLNGVDGWQGWDNVGSVAGMVSGDFSYTGANSIMIHGYTDAVQTFSNVNSGQWTISAKQYIGSGQGGNTYFILMNRYIDGGNNDSGMWSGQFRFDLGAGRVYDDFRGGSVAIATDQWADLKFNVDLSSNTISSYYNDQLISSGSWTTSGSSSLALAAVDLYSADNNFAYYDSLSIQSVPAPGGAAAFALMLLGTRRSRRA